VTFRQTTLPNGLTVIAELRPEALSAALGYFVRTGARDETPEIAGLSHFLEHMAFKGSNRRTAADVNREFDEIGANHNAWTAEEHTVYHAVVLPEHLDRCVDLLADLLSPTIREEDFETEKKVIIEEIGMYQDMPMWAAFEVAMKLHFDGHPVGNSILGSKESVGALTSSAMRDYLTRRYTADNVILAASGNVDWNRLVDLAAKHSEGWRHVPPGKRSHPSYAPKVGSVSRSDKFVQETAIFVTPGPDASCERRLRLAAELLVSIVGDDTGSRFHWDLVEPGIVESIDLRYEEYEDAGMFMVTAGFDPEAAAVAVPTIKRILKEVSAGGVTDDELAAARNKIGSRIVLAGERPRNRLFSLGLNWSYRGEHIPVERDLADIAAITPADIRELLQRWPLTPRTGVALGPMETVPDLLPS
jgi:predicted Zn-dependent peptidase